MRVFPVALLFVFAMSGAAAAPGDLQDIPEPEVVERSTLLLETMSDIYPQTMAVLAGNFPQDLAVFVSVVEDISLRERRQPSAQAAAFRSLTEMRRKYDARVFAAPGAAQAAMLTHLASFYDLVLENEGPEVCGLLAHGGSSVLFARGLAEKYAERLDRQSMLYLEAVLGAAPGARPPSTATPEDWSEMLRAIEEAGAPRSFRLAIEAGDPTNPELCPALALLLRTTAWHDVPAARRVRADFAKNLAGY